MCLFKKHKFPRLTLWPKTVYKVIHKDTDTSQYYTMYQAYPIKFGETIKATGTLKEGIKNNTIHGEGVHAYTSRLTALSEAFFGNGEAVEAVIPAFTWYWEGTDFDIAARRLIILNKRVERNHHDSNQYYI